MTAGFREKALTPLFRFGVIFIVAAGPPSMPFPNYPDT